MFYPSHEHGSLRFTSTVVFLPLSALIIHPCFQPAGAPEGLVKRLITGVVGNKLAWFDGKPIED